MCDLESVVNAFNSKGFIAKKCETSEQARNEVLELIREDKSIGLGGSMTLMETGIYDSIIATGKEIFSAVYEKTKENPDPQAAYKKAMTADVYMLSANAVIASGEFINIDGNSNRMGAFIYGPDKVIVVAGRNKISPNPHNALTRIKREACPKNAKRLNLDTPCAKFSECKDCNSPQRMCRVTVRMQYPPRGKAIYLFLVDEDLGY